MENNITLIMQIAGTLLTGVILFWVNDIKNSINLANQNFLMHVQNSEIHCSKEKFNLERKQKMKDIIFVISLIANAGFIGVFVIPLIWKKK